jgi:hypothetical protein
MRALGHMILATVHNFIPIEIDYSMHIDATKHAMTGHYTNAVLNLWTGVRHSA